MEFQPTITNEQTAELPSAHFDGKITIVDRDDQIMEVCRDLARHKIIGFDTETRPSFKAGVSNKVALLQLSTPECCYLIRLCKIKLHNAILKILSNPEIIKIGADVTGDLRALHVLRNFNERGFIDLQQIASNWGIEEKSLRKMSAIVLGQRVSKAQRLSNWEASVLTPQQQLYAATDAWVCIKIYEKLLSTPCITADGKPDLKMIERIPQATVAPAKVAEAEKSAKQSKPARRRRYFSIRRKATQKNTEKHSEQ